MLKIAWSEEYRHSLPPKHRFPMEKYTLIPEQLIYEGTVEESNFFKPGILSEERILSIHEEEYWNKLQHLKLSRSEERRTGFPLSKELVHRERRITQGSIECCDFALNYGIAFNVAGGTHHAYRDRGEGFCLLNDIAVSSQYLLDNNLVKQILVVDLDVHQGNGTAKIFEGVKEVFTFSMHGAKNYPLKKEKSDLDVELPDGIKDKEYLSLLDRHLKETLETVRPDFIFFQAGVDILETDKLGRLGVSKEGCKERDRMVLKSMKQNQIPGIVSMGGGYSVKIADIVEAHANTYRLAQEIYF